MLRSIILATICASCAAYPSIVAADQVAPVDQVRALSQRLLDALSTGDAATWDRYVDAKATIVDESGTVISKAELLKQIVPLPAGSSGKIVIRAYEARSFGDIVVSTHRDAGEQIVLGQTVRPAFQSIETWRNGTGGWKLIGSQTVNIEGPPRAQALPRAWLKEYEGSYAASASVSLHAKVVGKRLQLLRAGRPPKVLETEARDVFFSAGAPGRMIAIRDTVGRITGLVDRRSGQDVVWTKH